MKLLSHQNVVRFHHATVDPTVIYIVMEYVRGWTLEEFVSMRRGRRLSEDHARQIFSQLVNAVIYLHSLGVAHRDLKVVVVESSVLPASFLIAELLMPAAGEHPH